MIENIFNSLSDYLYGSFWLALFASFSWGILSILLSPCHLSGIPLIVGYISSQGRITLSRTFSLSLVFAIGILLTIAIIGGITLSAGRLMGDVGTFGNYFVALVFFIVGMYLLGIIKLPWDSANLTTGRFRGFLAIFILGLFFGIGLGPCTFAFMAPVLGVVFSVAQTDTIFAAGLLIAFSIGHCAVIVAAGTLTNRVQKYLNWSDNSKVIIRIKKVCGALVIFGGIYMILNTIY